MIGRKTSAARAAGLVLLAVAPALLASPASAQTATGTLEVTATVTENCTLATSPVAFGSVNTLGGNVDAIGGITVTCTADLPWSAAADVGGGSAASFAARAMSDGAGNELAYNLYTDIARSTVWGDDSGATDLLAATGTGVAQNLSVFGRVPGGQTSVPAGSYSDTVNVTVSY